MEKDYDAGIDVTDPEGSHYRQIQMVGTGKRVVDFGCYTGVVARALAERGCTVTGIELDPVAAEKAREVCERVVVGDLDRMDLAEALEGSAYDVGLFGDIIEHLKDPVRVLSQFRAHLAPGGFIVVSVPNVAHATVRLSLLKGEFNYENTGILDDTHLRYFTRKSIGDFIEACGYVVDRLDSSDLKVSRADIRSALDPLGLANLDEVIAALTSWEATAFQYIVKAFPASEEARVRKLSEDKVQAERRARELDAELSGLRREQEELSKKNEYLERVEQKLNDEMARSAEELLKVGRYVKDLEQKIDEKDAYIRQLEGAVAEGERRLEEKEHLLQKSHDSAGEVEPPGKGRGGRLLRRG